MKLSKVGFSNSTIISTSLLSFSSPRAKEPNRPILLTPNLFFISCSCRLKISIIFIIASCKYGRQRLKTCLFRPRKISAQQFSARVLSRSSFWVLGFSSMKLCLGHRPPSLHGPTCELTGAGKRMHAVGSGGQRPRRRRQRKGMRCETWGLNWPPASPQGSEN
jgi:hypothetical protein